jgi:predicted dehydrogenase
LTTKPIQTGIIGLGVVGQRRLALLNQHPGFEVKAVCDSSRAALAAAETTGVRLREASQLFEETLDAVFLCVPNYVTASLTRQALETRHHVFCEKPAGCTLDEVQQVRTCEQKHPNYFLMYGFNHRQHGSVQAALNWIRGEKLGEIINLNGVYGKSSIGPQGAWRTLQQEAGGGILLDQGIHLLDLMRLFAGEFTQIQGFVDNGYWKHDVEDNAYALMRTEAGVVAMMHSSATLWKHHFRLEISLSKGHIALQGILSGSGTYGPETLTVTPRSDSPPQHTTFTVDDSWSREIDHFEHCIRHRTSPTTGTSLDALRALELVHRIYDADPAGGTL